MELMRRGEESHKNYLMLRRASYDIHLSRIAASGNVGGRGSHWRYRYR